MLAELNLPLVERQMEMAAVIPPDENESRILRYVTYDPVHIDEITRNSTMPASDVSSALAMMELKGMVSQVGGMNYVRLKESAARYRTA